VFSDCTILILDCTNCILDCTNWLDCTLRISPEVVNNTEPLCLQPLTVTVANGNDINYDNFTQIVINRYIKLRYLKNIFE